MQFLKDEIQKIMSPAKIIFLLGIILAGNILVYAFYQNKGENWREAAQSDREMYVTAMNEAATADDGLGLVEMYQENIKIIDFSLENNVPYRQLSVISSLCKHSIFSNIIVIIIVMFVYGLIMVEFSNDTWKNMVVLYKKEYWKIIGRKALATLAFVVVLLTTFFVESILFGMIVYRNWTNILVSCEDGVIITQTYNAQLINVIGDLLARSLIYSGFSFLLAMIFKERKTGIVLMLVAIFLENSIYNCTESYQISKVLPFHYMHILENVMDYNNLGILCGAVLVSAIYIVLFMSGAYKLCKE